MLKGIVDSRHEGRVKVVSDPVATARVKLDSLSSCNLEHNPRGRGWRLVVPSLNTTFSI